MLRYFAISLLALSCISFAGEPKRYNKTDTFCEDAEELSTITSQLPDYALSSKLDTSAGIVGQNKFRPFGVLSAARGQPVCIAIVVSELGVVQDAAAYFPKRVALSRLERKQLMTTKYKPALQGGIPTKSIVLMKAWSD